MNSGSRCSLPLDPAQEVLQDLQEAFGLLSVRQMRALLEEHPLAAGDALAQDLLFGWCELVVAPGDEEGGNADLSEARSDIPVLEVASDVELTCSPHGLEHLRVNPLERLKQVIRPGVEPAYMARVEGHRGLLVGRIVGSAGRLVLIEHLLHFWWQLLTNLVDFGCMQRHAGRRVGDDQAE